jgi:hypothetical protein
MSDEFQAMPQNEDMGPSAVEDAIDALPLLIKEAGEGYKTTEFWLTVVISLLTLLNVVPLPDKYEGIVVAALGAAYAISRGLAKKGVPVVESPPQA